MTDLCQFRIQFSAYEHRKNQSNISGSSEHFPGARRYVLRGYWVRMGPVRVLVPAQLPVPQPRAGFPASPPLQIRAPVFAGCLARVPVLHGSRACRPGVDRGRYPHHQWTRAGRGVRRGAPAFQRKRAGRLNFGYHHDKWLEPARYRGTYGSRYLSAIQTAGGKEGGLKRGTAPSNRPAAEPLY